MAFSLVTFIGSEALCFTLAAEHIRYASMYVCVRVVVTEQAHSLLKRLRLGSRTFASDPPLLWFGPNGLSENFSPPSSSSSSMCAVRESKTSSNPDGADSLRRCRLRRPWLLSRRRRVLISCPFSPAGAANFCLFLGPRLKLMTLSLSLSRCACRIPPFPLDDFPPLLRTGNDAPQTAARLPPLALACRLFVPRSIPPTTLAFSSRGIAERRF